MKRFHPAINSFTEKSRFILICLLLLHLFFRYFELEQRAQFSWDQVDNAWVAKNLIVDHKYPLLGMPAKQNTGINIGPGYYYVVTFFYWIFNLDPIASPIIAFLTSIVTFFVLYYVTKKIFNKSVALLSCFLYAISFYTISYDRIQWPVNLIPAFSFLIFYSLYSILLGKYKHFLLLGFILGLSFHIHFTSLLYIPLIITSLPFIKWNKKMFLYSFYSVLIFFVFLIPSIAAQFLQINNQIGNISHFFHTNYHGFHVRRIIQVSSDAFIEFSSILTFKSISFLKFLLLPLFIFLYMKEKEKENKMVLCYLFLMWFLVPWVAFSVYRGEISNYYFSLTKLHSVVIISCCMVLLFSRSSVIPKVAVVGFLLIFSWENTVKFFSVKSEGLLFYKQTVQREIKNAIDNEFIYGAPGPYIHYFYKRRLYKWK